MYKVCMEKTFRYCERGTEDKEKVESHYGWRNPTS